MRPFRFARRPALWACLLSLLLCYAMLLTGTTIPVAHAIKAERPARAGIVALLKPPASRPAPRPAQRDGELLVRFRPLATEPAINNLLAGSNGQLLRRLRGASRFVVVRVPRGLEERAVSELRRSPLVEWAEPNALIKQEEITPNDPRFGEQWALHNTGVNSGRLGSDLHLPQAWETTTGSSETVIAVIDSGIDFTHPDLRANRWSNHSAPANVATNQPGGFVNDRHGWDFVLDTPDGKDEAGHGTAVAGLIAAEGNNRVGIAGVMWRASLMDLRVLDANGTGDVAAAAEAIDYATAHGAQVLNLSWSTDYPSRALAEALQRAARRGVLAVCAAGNQGADLSTAPRYPAALALGNVIAVTATDEYDRPAAWSNFGLKTGALAAPGVNLLTTQPGGGYQTISGTSGAAALVSGVAGLIRTVRPYLSAEQTRALLVQGARTADGSTGSLAQAAGALSRAESLPAGEGLANTRNQNGGEHQAQTPAAPPNTPNSTNTPANAPPNLPGVGGPPRPGLPNLDVLRQQQPQAIRAMPHIPPPAWRHPRMPRAPRNGRRVGDPLPLPSPNPSPSATPAVTPPPIPHPSPAATPFANLFAPPNNNLPAWAGWAGTDKASPSGPSDMGELWPWANTDAGFTSAPADNGHENAPAALPATPPLGELSVEGWFLDFYQTALAQYPLSNEQDYWYDLMRKAREVGSNSCANGQCLLAARDVGRTIFESPAYYARDRNNTEYVSDLYQTYLHRTGSTGEVAWWAGVVPTYGRDAVRRAFDESGEFSGIINGLTQEGSSGSGATNVWAAKQDLLNGAGGSGVDPVSRNFGWSLPLVGLPGRAGLDLGLTLAYNSAVWTKSGPYAYFDEENGFPGPGFRLGFPTIQNRYFNPNTGKNAYLLITPGGGRVELRQVGSGTTYEAADSSYLQLLDQGGSLWLRSTDGTQLSFSKINDEWRCVQIKDRNGNYLTISYKWWGQINTITDTLGRVLTFEYYSSNQNLYRITQSWSGTTRVYALFEYETRNIASPFGGSAIAIGAGIGTTQANSWPMLNKVWLSDGSHVDFAYLNSGQVFLIKRWANDGVTELGNNWLNMDSAAGYQDRVSWSSMKAKNWNLVSGVPQDVYTYYDTPTAASWNWTAPYGTAADGSGKKTRITLPDNTKQDIYFFDSGWKRGLVGYTETLIPIYNVDTWQRRTGSLYTQDDTGLNYRLNPRVTESAVGDLTNNRRSTVSYTTAFGLPQDSYEYAANGTTVLRHAHTDYLPTSMSAGVYFDNRIIGLPEDSYLYDETNQLAAHTKLEYDTPANISALPGGAAATQHDAAYTASSKRGLVTKAIRYKTASQSGDNSPATITSEAGYFITGAPAFSRDPLGHQSNISYADSFSDNINNRNTFAYPTKVTDPDGFFSTVIYNFNFGGVTRTDGPPPANNPNGAINTTTYDGIGRVERVTTVNNGAYTRFLYGPDYTASWTTINTLAEEAYSVQFVDGLGQVTQVGSQHPGSVGQYKAQTTTYDKLGRVVKSSNPAEVNSSWNPAGDDSGGWHYRTQTYDWKGRSLVSTNTDGTQTEAQYGGCGCAGGQIVTLLGQTVPIPGTSDPVQYSRRLQKQYSDSLGRPYQTETYNWPDSNGVRSVYSSTLTEYNALDQVTRRKQYPGAATGSNYQETFTQYDGHGRPWRTHAPEMDNNKWQTVVYNNDDSAQFTTDPRGVNINYTYNNRRLVTGISYDKSAATNPDSIPAVPTANFTYDAVGNRLAMGDSNSTVLYQYDPLSRLTSEARTINGLSDSFTLSYEYSVGGLLKKITDPFSTSISYAYDRTGQLTGVTGTGSEVEPTYISNVKYRAWGATNRVDFGNATYQTTNFDVALRPSSFSVGNVRVNPSTPNSSVTLNWNYNYYSDGKLQQTSDSGDNRFDQRFDYDQVGHMKEAYSGNEARGQQPDLPYYNQVPYRSSFTYNPFGQITARTGRVYWYGQTDSGTYLNNRRTDYGYVYNEAGRLVEDRRKYTYDAANRHTRSVSWWQSDMAGDGSTEFPFQPAIDISQTYDADGQTVKRVQISRRNYYDELQYPSPLIQVLEDGQTNYELRSSVLGGAVILRLALDYQQNATVTERNIYAGGKRIAKGRVYEHHNPVTGSWITTNYNSAPFLSGGGNYWYWTYLDRWESREERDPTGGELPLTFPEYPLYVNTKWEEPLYIEGGDPFDYSSGYEIDGLPVSAAELNRRLGNGSVDVTQTIHISNRGFSTVTLDVYQGVNAFFFEYATSGSVRFEPSGIESPGRILENNLGADLGVVNFAHVSTTRRSKGFIDCANAAGLSNFLNFKFFADYAANIVLNAATAEGISPELLLFTWYKETPSQEPFNPRPSANTNPGLKLDSDLAPTYYDFGPFQINQHYLFVQVLEKKRFNLNGIDLVDALGFDPLETNGPSGSFKGNPLANARLAARWLKNLPAKTDGDKAAQYTNDDHPERTTGSNPAGRKSEFNEPGGYGEKFRDFLNCHQQNRHR